MDFIITWYIFNLQRVTHSMTKRYDNYKYIYDNNNYIGNYISISRFNMYLFEAMDVLYL